MAETTTTMADQRIPQILSANAELIIADRGSALMRNSGALVYQGDFVNEPALSKKCRLIGWMGYDRLAARAEGAGAIADTALTDGKVDLSVGPFVKQYSGNEFVALHSPSSIYNNPQQASMDAVVSRDATLVDTIAGLSDDWTATAGATGTAMSVDKFFEAIGTLEAANVPARPGEVVWQGLPAHYRELAEDLRTEQGVMEHQAVTAEMQAIKGDNFRGSLGGVDLFVSNSLVVSSGDTYSHMWARGGVYWGDASPRVGPAAIGFEVDKVFIEFSRTANTLTDRTTVHAWFGVATAQQAAGVKILSQT